MSHFSHRQPEGDPVAQTLSSQPTQDDSLLIGQREQRSQTASHLSCVARVAAPAAGGARMNQQEEHAACNASTQSRQIKIGCTGEGWPKSDVPYLRLRGRWLERAGFAIGRRVRVDVKEGQLIIKPVD